MYDMSTPGGRLKHYIDTNVAINPVAAQAFQVSSLRIVVMDLSSPSNDKKNIVAEANNSQIGYEKLLAKEDVFLPFWHNFSIIKVSSESGVDNSPCAIPYYHNDMGYFSGKNESQALDVLFNSSWEIRKKSGKEPYYQGICIRNGLAQPSNPYVPCVQHASYNECCKTKDLWFTKELYGCAPAEVCIDLTPEDCDISNLDGHLGADGTTETNTKNLLVLELHGGLFVGGCAPTNEELKLAVERCLPTGSQNRIVAQAA